ncbi:ribosomal protein S18 acetylase RimI-like enzyme [Rhodococcus sp. 27YEA15]|uniref:GNAT family N-acetyltransferase n=1 Tax=Rhodococcus sp. 27YEA15 TaxID=3156259 RepID=UPI003C79CFFE
MGVLVRPAARSDIAPLSAVLADAFDDDPVMTWMLPDPSTRIARLKRLFAAETRYHHLAGGGAEVAAAEDGTIGGAALWDPPGRWQQSRASALISLPAMARAFGRNLVRAGQTQSMMEDAHPRTRHWYLGTIGTSSTARGGGYGAALLNSRLDRCDHERIDAYLESSKESNISYYNRFGFDVTREIVIPAGGPTLYAMTRTPR